MSAYSVQPPADRIYPYITAQSHTTACGQPAVLLCLSSGLLNATQRMTTQQARELAANLQSAADDAEQQDAAA